MLVHPLPNHVRAATSWRSRFVLEMCAPAFEKKNLRVPRSQSYIQGFPTDV